MTLDINKLLFNSLTKQFKIAHLPIDVMAFKTEDIPENISKKLLDQYGETYLEDSQYVLFFKGGIDKDVREKLFKQVDRALGGNKDKKKNANLLSIGDLKLLKMKDDEEDITSSDEGNEDTEIEDQVNDIVNEPEDSDKQSSSDPIEDQNDDAIDDAISTDEEIPEEPEAEEDSESDEKSEEDDSEEEDSSDEEDVEESLNEDNETIENSEEATPSLPTRYVFLKITLKK